MSGKKPSIGTLKCCSEGKDLTCYYCVSCTSIQHRSCVERKKSTVFIGGYKIYCGKECAKYGEEELLKDDHEQEIKQLKEIIAEQHAQNLEKTNALEKQRRNSIAFENDVEDAEKHFKAKLREYQARITLLEEKISIQVRKNNEISENEKLQKEQREIQHKKTYEELQQRYKQLEEKNTDLREKIMHYRDEETEYMKTILLRDAQIEELKKNMERLTRTDMAEDVRQKNSEIENFKVQTVLNKKQLKEGKEALKKITQERDSLLTLNRVLEDKIVELNELSKSMIDSIKCLENENQSYFLEVDAMKKQLNQFSGQLPTCVQIQKKVEKKKKNKPILTNLALHL